MKSYPIRPEIMDFEPYKPGMNIEQIKSKYNLQTVVKLASNENPLGVSPKVEEAICKHAKDAFRYPLTGSPELVNEIAKMNKVDPEQIIVGHGSDELIDMLIRMCCIPGHNNVLCYENSFSMYRLTARLCGVDYYEVKRGENFALPVDELARTANSLTSLVFLTNPDNPTGQTATVEDITVMAGVLPKETMLVLDEAYIDFAWPPEAYTPMPVFNQLDNVIIMRTFSKAYGLADLRLGYMVLPRKMADYLRRARIPFTVSRLTEVAGLAALADDNFYSKTVNLVHKQRDYMMSELPHMDCEVLNTQANFFMFKPPVPAQGLFRKLLTKGVIVRPLASFGLGSWIRVNVGQEGENVYFLEQLEKALNGK